LKFNPNNYHTFLLRYTYTSMWNWRAQIVREARDTTTSTISSSFSVLLHGSNV
jgi:hypothetical protein